MRPALRDIILADRLFPGAYYAADFLKRQFRLNGVRYTRFSDIPGVSIARASDAYAETPWSTLQLFASGVPRITDRGLLVEAAATNLCLWSGDQTNAAWTASNVTVAMNAVGPDGVANSAATLTATAGNATLKQTFTIASAVKDFALYMRRVTGTGNIDMTLDDGTLWTTKTLTTQWQRFDITQTLANPVIGVRIVTSGDVIEVYGGQLVAQDHAKSYIPTTTASVTRAADVISIGSITGLDYPLSVYAEVERASDTGGTEEWLSVDGGSNVNQIRIGLAAADTTFVQINTASVSQGLVSVAGAVSVGTITKLAARGATNSMQIAKNGTLGTEDTGVTAPSAPTRISLPSSTHGYLRKLAIFPSAYTDAQLQAITS